MCRINENSAPALCGFSFRAGRTRGGFSLAARPESLTVSRGDCRPGRPAVSPANGGGGSGINKCRPGTRRRSVRHLTAGSWMAGCRSGSDPAVSPDGTAGTARYYHPRSPIASYGSVTLNGTASRGIWYRVPREGAGGQRPGARVRGKAAQQEYKMQNTKYKIV